MNDYLKGISSQAVTKDQQEILCAPVDPADVEVKPASFLQVYLSHGKYRERLNKAFGAGGWGMVPVGEPEEKAGYLMQKWALWAGDRCLDVSRGAQLLGNEDDDKGMSWDDAEESAKSNAIVRCCKAIGIAAECWDRKWIAGFRENYCVQVWVEGQKRPLWRRQDDPPLYRETGMVRKGERPVADPPPKVEMLKKEVEKKENGKGTYISVDQQKSLFEQLKVAGKRTLNEFQLYLTQRGKQGTGSILVSEFDSYVGWLKGEEVSLSGIEEAAKKLGKTPQELAEEWGYPAPERVPPEVLKEIFLTIPVMDEV